MGACCTEEEVCGDEGLINTVDGVTCASFPIPNFTCCTGGTVTDSDDDTAGGSDDSTDSDTIDGTDTHTNGTTDDHDHGGDDHDHDTDETTDGDSSTSSVTLSVFTLFLSKLF